MHVATHTTDLHWSHLYSHNAGEGIRKERVDTIHHATNLLYERYYYQLYMQVCNNSIHMIEFL